MTTFSAVRCPHCQNDQVAKRGKTACGTQRYLCQNALCAKSSFLLDSHNRGCVPEVLLWQGDMQGLRVSIGEQLSGKKRLQALKKWKDFFAENAKRMQYASFQEAHIPCGSGGVESAIRRVINLRLKAPGSFWTKEMAEYFLFVRSQLLSGRWDIFMKNVRC